MKFLQPSPAMKDAYWDYIQEWESRGETIIPMAVRPNGRTYEAWLADTQRMETQSINHFVTQSVYFACDEDGRILGVLALRHTLNDLLLQTGGHIGYGVRPSARGKGIAAAMVAAVKPLARARGLSRVLITCDKTNLASARTIQSCGGALENEVPHEGKLVQRYWIAL